MELGTGAPQARFRRGEARFCHDRSAFISTHFRAIFRSNHIIFSDIPESHPSGGAPPQFLPQPLGELMGSPWGAPGGAPHPAHGGVHGELLGELIPQCMGERFTQLSGRLPDSSASDLASRLFPLTTPLFRRYSHHMARMSAAGVVERFDRGSGCGKWWLSLFVCILPALSFAGGLDHAELVRVATLPKLLCRHVAML